jgi:XTP/dITP diphosphohydrolase
MSHTFIIASNNAHKVSEIQLLIGSQFTLKTLADIGFTEDIPETGDTLVENALIKARHIYAIYQQNCFADDSGLEIDALNGAPGVYSARYAGEPVNHQKNNEKVLAALLGKSNRNAAFRTVIALIFEGQEFIFEGKIEGKITESFKGNNGFGYDPIFQPNGYEQCFAEMSLSEKTQISHRGIAVAKLAAFINNS